MAAMAVGTAAIPAYAQSSDELISGVVAEMDYYEDNFPISSYYTYSGCQTVYPASMMDEGLRSADAYSVKEVICPFSATKPVPASGKIQIAMYIGKTSETTNSEWIPESELVEIFSGEVDLADAGVQASKALSFPVNFDFVMDKGESLVVAWQTSVVEKFSSNLYFGNPESTFGVHSRYYKSSESNATFSDLLAKNAGHASAATSQYVPSLDIRYTLAESSGSGDDEGEIGDIVEKAIVGGTYSTGEYPLCVQSWNYYSASQSLYPSVVLDEKVKVDTYTVKELVYPMLTAPTSGKVKLTAMMASASDNSFGNAFPDEAFTVVAHDMEVDFSEISDGCLRIPLSRPFVMHRGESMIVGLLADIDDATRPDPYPAFISGQTGVSGYHSLYCTSSTEVLAISDVTLSSDFVGGLTLVYMIGEETIEEPEVTDLALTGLTAPEDQTLYTDNVYGFTVSLTNNGTQPVEDYTVEIVNADNDEVLASVANPKVIPSLMSANVTVDVTFKAGGSYNLVARVVLEGDEDADNNQSEPVAVEVRSLDYKAVAVTGPSEVKPDEELTYTVTVGNEGSSELSGYSVELYLVRENMADVLVGSSNDNPAIAAGSTVDVEFAYTFALGGKYGLKAVVNIEGGVPSETAVFDVNVVLEGVLSPVISEQLPKWNGSSYDIQGTSFYRGYTKAATQLMYPAEFFGDHPRPYQIQSLTLTVVKEEYNVDPMQVKIYMAQTDRTDGYTKANNTIDYIPAEDFVLVYDGAIATKVSMSAQTIKLDLQRLFTLENGKSLVLNVETRMDSDSSPALELAAANADDAYQAYTRMSETVYDAPYSHSFTSNLLPCITFGYALEALPPTVDVVATELQLPSGDVEANEELSFRVYFENKGNVALEDYTIELLSLDSDGEEEVLQSYEGTRYLATGMSANQPVKYTFAEAGEYTLAARIVAENDSDNSNNRTPAVKLSVGGSSSVGNLVADGTLAYDAAARVLNVNLGACTVTVSDLAGRAVAVYNVKGASALPVSLPAGVYVVSANGKTLKVRI